MNRDIDIANRAIMVNDSNLKQLENTLSQIYLSSEVSPFYYSQDPNKAYLLKQKLSMLNAVNGLCQEIIVYFRNDNFIYSTKGSYTLDFFTEKAFVYSNWEKKEMIYTLQNTKENIIRPAERIEGYGLGNPMENHITFIYPLNGFNATVMFIIPENRYKMFMENMAERKGNYYISENTGSIITSSSMFDFDNTLVKNILAGKGEVLGSVVQYKDGRYLVTAVSSKLNGWKYVSITPVDAILQPLKKEQQIFLLCFLGVALIGGISIYVFSSINYKPIKHLHRLLQIKGNENKDNINEIQTIQNAIMSLADTNIKLKIRLDESKNASRVQLAIDLLKSKILEWSALEERCRAVGIELCSSNYVVMVMYFKDTFNNITNQQLLLSNIEANLPEGICGIGMEEVSVNKCNLILFLKEETENSFRETLALFFQRTVTSLCPSAVAGISSTYSDLTLIHHAFFEASGAADYRLVMGDGQIIFFQDVETRTGHIENYPHRQIESISKVLQRGDVEEVDSRVNILFEYVRSSKATLITSRCICYDVINLIMKEYYQIEQLTKEHISLDYDIFSFVQTSSVEELSNMLKNVCQDLCMRRKLISQSISTEISEILNFIDNNCCDQNFSLQLVSEKYNISMPKLSSWFKDEIGYSPLDYIFKIRINRTKELLVSTEYNIKDIALRVGYIDVSSFTRKFRQTVGVTPAIYRKMNTDEVV